MIKDIYSANIEFISRAQGGASVDDAASFAALRVANMETVAAIKATKHLRSNLQHSLRSGNPLLRREYNRLRIRVGGVLRELAALRESEDPVVTLLSLDPIRVSAVDAAEHAASRVDELIRERRITSQMATSLINDGIYTRELIDHMLNVTEAVSRAVLPAGDTLSEKLSLQLDEIADIARSMDGGADPQD